MQKTPLLKSLSLQLQKETKKLQKVPLSKSDRYQTRKIISCLKKDISRLKNFEPKWNPFNVSRNIDDQHQWMSKMKRHLRMSILATGKTRIK